MIVISSVYGFVYAFKKLNLVIEDAVEWEAVSLEDLDD
jgi:hypothetical protein